MYEAQIPSSKETMIYSQYVVGKTNVYKQY